jgi:hypothetical protein
MKRHSGVATQAGNGNGVAAPPSLPPSQNNRILNPGPRVPPNGPLSILPASTTGNNMTVAMAAQHQMLTMPQLHYNMASKNPPQFSYN